MNEERLAALLAELTGQLLPAGSTSPDALHQVRRLVANALLSGQVEVASEPSGPGGPVILEDVSPDELDALQRVIHDVSPAPRDASLRVYRRTWPMLSDLVPQSVPAWARGWRPSETFGPFESADCQLIWFDLRRTDEVLSVVDVQSGQLLFTVPGTTFAAGPPAGGLSTIELPPGTIWLAAQAFDANAPAASLAGLRIRGGGLSFSHPAIVHGNVIAAAPGIVATLQLRLDPVDRPPRSPHAGDARSLDVDPVTEAVFEFGVGVAGGSRLTRTDTAHLGAFGSRVRLRLRDDAAPRYDASLAFLWFSMKADRGSFSIDESHSQLLSLAGAAPIRDAGWALPVAVPTVPPAGGPVTVPGDAVGAGALGLVLEKGLKGALQPLPAGQLAALDSAVLLASPSLLSARASVAAARIQRTVELWKPETGRRARVELRTAEPLRLELDATAQDKGAEALRLLPVECRTDLDRPVTAAAKPVPFFSTQTTVDIFHLDLGLRLFLTAAADSLRDPVSGRPFPPQPLSLALSNALVGASAALVLRLGGVLSAALRVERGVLRFDFAPRFLLPFLPDPYAANIARQAPRQLLHTAETLPGRLLARVRWSETAGATLAFALVGNSDLGLPQMFVELEQVGIQHEGRRQRDYLAEVEALFPQGSGQGRELLRLLDVSSNADLFGVGISGTALRKSRSAPPLQLQLQGLELIASMRHVSAFTLPAFQWEPVYNIPNEADPFFPHKLSSATDGGATRFATPAATLVPVAPLPLVDQMLEEYGNEVALSARFTLPFGMVAVAQMRHQTSTFDLGFSSPRFGRVRPGFSENKLQGGLQLVLEAGPRFLAPLGGPSTGLPGATVQADNSTDGKNVLKSGFVDDIFNGTFADAMKMVPVQRIDFTGYGASTFSDWRHENVKGSGVTQVKFHALVGRTSREVVQVRSKLYPWGAIVVRIITMERSGSGGVFRRDSGWQAASDGRYDLPGCVVHSGVVPRLTNIRRIRDTTNVFERVYPTGTMKVAKVVFDADVEIESVTLGANDARLVPARDIVGYVQVLPIGADLTAEQLNDLLLATGAIGGPIDCELNVAQSGLHMHLSRIEVDRTMTLANNPQFVAVARGTADLARAGEWTFVRRAAGEQELHRLETNRPIPLIRANPSGGVTAPYRIADASELHRVSSPLSEYGLLQSTGAQRLLIPQPQLRWAEATIHGGAPMLFADMYALAGGIALFPRPERCHPLPAGSALRISGRSKVRLDVAAQAGLAAGEFKATVSELILSQSATMRMRSRFAPDATIRLIIDSDLSPDWSCEFGPVSTLADIGDLDELTQVVGTMTSSAHAAPQLTDPQMVFGGPLAPVQTIISFLTAFGLPFPFDLQVTNQKYGFKSGWKYVFPKYGFGAIDKALKSGPGLMLEVELQGRWGKESEDAKVIGKDISEHSLVSTKGVPKGPDAHNWHFVFEADAKLLARVFSLGAEAFLGGALKVEIGGEEEGKTKLSLFTGLSGVVELDTVAFSVSGGRSYLLGFEHLIGAKQVAIGGCSEWEVEGAFLDGLAAVKVSFELKTMIHPAEDFHFEGSGTIAIDVTLAWALSKTFEVEIDVDERVAAALFVAGTVL